jgi:RNA polymerase sigma-70 factor, ECF subfamily
MKNSFYFNRSAIMKSAWLKYKKDEILSDELFYSHLRDTWRIAKSNSVSYNFNELYKKHYKEIVNSINFKLYGDIEQAKDLANDTFEKVYKNLCIFNPESCEIATWIRSIANNTVIDYFRKQKYVSKVDVADIVVMAETKSNIESNELKGSIYKAINNLKPLYRKIAKLYFIDGRQYSEIADLCKIPLNTLKVNILRIRNILQSELVNERYEYLGK